MFPDLAIVRDVCLLIDFGAFADPCDSEGRSIYCGIGSYFNVIFYDNFARLRDAIIVSALIPRKTKAFGTDCAVGHDLAALADFSTRADVQMRVKVAIFAYLGISFDYHRAIDPNIISNAYISPDNGICAYRNVFTNHYTSINHSARMNG